MYWRFRRIVFIFLLGLSNIYADIDEDSLILKALDLVDNNDYKSALEVYKNLFDATKKKEYLREIVHMSFQLNRLDDVIKYANIYEKDNKNDLKIKKILTSAYFNSNKIDMAIKYAKEIVDLEDTAENNKYLSTLFFIKNDFNESRIYALKAYEIQKDADLLMLIVSIDMENKNFAQSVPLIKDFYKNTIEEQFALILNSYALKYKLIPEVRDLYMQYLEKNNVKENALNLARIHILNNEINKAIEISQKYKFDRNFMIDLYLIAKDYDRAYDEANKAFEENKDNSYLGILAIIEFERAKNKKEVLDSVIAKFKKAIDFKPNHILYNYLGYLLIDFDIDVDDGMKYVNLALKYEPNNSAYIDSLAWGFYKKKDCIKAKAQMDKIPADDIKDDIKEHIKIIEQCLSK